MKRILFITYWPFENEASNGICKKIRAQAEALSSFGMQVDLTYMKNGNMMVLADGKELQAGKARPVIGKMLASRQIKRYLKKSGTHVDGVYIRYALSDPWFLGLLRYLKKQRVRVLLEIPTYPYDGEFTPDLRGRLAAFLDRRCRKKLKGLADRVVTFTEDEEIFGIPTIRTVNGVDFSKVPLQYRQEPDGALHLIAVAGLAPWHGYDRLLVGMGEYYQNGGTREAVFHLVGDGSELPLYKKLVEEYGLESRVRFYGFLSGDPLTEVYNRADIAVSSLGMHRIGLFKGSVLKSREYAARGIPMITSCKLDIFPEDWKYQLVVPGDDSPVAMERVFAFGDALQEERDAGVAVEKEIRERARDKIEMKNTFRKIAEEFQ